MNDDIRADRRTLLQTGAMAGVAMIAGASPGTAQTNAEEAALSGGDVAILRFLAAAEIIESDLWVQYNEVGGVQNNELPGLGGGGSPAYTAALQNLDVDMPQYIHDNTEDELTHWSFLNAYLTSKNARPVDLDRFRTLPSSRATGAKQIGRLTNLMQLTVDTSWYTRYRNRRHNPDLDSDLKFAQAVPSLAAGRFPAIPRSDADLTPAGHIQAIANTAAFHFCLIEQGGTSLYPTLAQSVSGAQVLRVLLSIGPTEACHFQTWHDKAGNAVQPPLAPLTDPTNPKLVFPNLNAPPFGGEDFQTNLIMPEPCPFLSPHLPAVSIVRPTMKLHGGAVAAVHGLAAQGLFIGQTAEFFEFLLELAHGADAARRDR